MYKSGSAGEINFNGDLARPILDGISMQWETLFGTRIIELLKWVILHQCALSPLICLLLVLIANRLQGSCLHYNIIQAKHDQSNLANSIINSLADLAYSVASKISCTGTV